jgi:hypothetical protein
VEKIASILAGRLDAGGFFRNMVSAAGEHAMTYTVHHTTINGNYPHWCQYDGAYRTAENAIHRARNLVLDNGGYCYVLSHTGIVVFGTDPVALDRCILMGTNRHFAKPSNSGSGQ